MILNRVYSVRFSIFIFFLHFCLQLNLVTNVTIADYCKQSVNNTVCQNRCERHERCGRTRDSYTRLTEKERQIVLDKHNALRQQVARGALAGHYLPSCYGGMSVLSWDKECEFVTTCHQLQCIWDHDKGRHTYDGRKMSQNLQLRRVKRDDGFKADFIEHGIQAWYNEFKLLTEAEADMHKDFKKKSGAGHLTIVLWGNIKYVGCSKFHYFQNNRHQYTLFCNYLPVGNVGGMWVCENKTCEHYNDKYPSLCGKVRPEEEDTYTSPIHFAVSTSYTPEIIAFHCELLLALIVSVLVI